MALTNFVIFADFALSTIVSKKLTETVSCIQCVTKKSFLSYSIFNLRKSDNSPMLFALTGVALLLYHRSGSLVKQFAPFPSISFENFSEFPEKIVFMRLPNEQLAYNITFIKGLSTVFYHFFCLFFAYFLVIFWDSISCVFELFMLQ